MCRMLGVMCNDEDLLPCALAEVRDAIRLSPGDYDGYGVGYYSHDDPLLVRRPCDTRPCDVDYATALGDITSNVVVAHVQDASISGWKDSNTQPYRFRKWLFGHLGQLPALLRNRAEVVRALPPFLSRNLQGETDSELLCHMFFDQLYKTGKVNDLALTGEQFADSLKVCIDAVDRIEPKDKRQDLAVIATNGQVMGAACRGITLHYSHREGILECARHEASDQQQHVHRRFHGILLAVGMENPGHQWREVADASLVSVSRELELRVREL